MYLLDCREDWVCDVLRSVDSSIPIYTIAYLTLLACKWTFSVGLFRHHAMKAHGGVKVWLHLLFNLDIGQRWVVMIEALFSGRPPHSLLTVLLELRRLLKADSHIACRAHAVPLPCRAAKGLQCVFPIWFTQCGRVRFTLAMPRPCLASTMPFFSRQRHRAAVQRRPVGDLPAIGFFRLPRGAPGKLLSEAY